METTLILIRHGETEWNLKGRWQGHDDSPLTENGTRQARMVAESLAGFPFSSLYSSDLGRAMETAAHVSRETGKEIVTDTRLRERALGIFQGLTTSEMRNKYPREFQEFFKSNPDYAIRGAESTRQRFNRNIDCFNELANRHHGETIVIVCHGGVIDSLFRYVIGISLEGPRKYKIWNTGKNTFSHNQGTWQLLVFGDTNHLKDVATLDDE